MLAWTEKYLPTLLISPSTSPMRPLTLSFLISNHHLTTFFKLFDISSEKGESQTHNAFCIDQMMTKAAKIPNNVDSMLVKKRMPAPHLFLTARVHDWYRTPTTKRKIENMRHSCNMFNSGISSDSASSTQAFSLCAFSQNVFASNGLLRTPLNHNCLNSASITSSTCSDLSLHVEHNMCMHIHLW